MNKSETVTSQKFTVASPVATASVRGTRFNFDTITLRVTQGQVEFRDSRGNVVEVKQGETAKVAPEGTKGGIVTNRTLISQESSVSSSTGSDFGMSEVSDESGWDGWSFYDYEDLLAFLEAFLNYDSAPMVYASVGGLSDVIVPTTTYVWVGGIDPGTSAASTTVATYVYIGGNVP